MRALLYAALLLLPVASHGVDMVGTWEGKIVCSEFDGERSRIVVPDQTLIISGTPGDFNLVLVGVTTFDAVWIDDAKKPDVRGDLMVADCGSDSDLSTGFSELGRFKVKVNRDAGKGSLRGTSFLVIGSPSAATCRWKFKLVDLADPGGISCP